MKTEQTFFQKTKRFFEPIKSNKLVTFKMITYFFVQYSFGIIFIFFVRQATEALESGDKILLNEILIKYFLIFIGTFIIIFLMNKWWIYSYNRYRSFVEEKYFPKFITFDQNIQETIGTGKSIAIISKGIKMWGRLIDLVFIESVGFITSIFLALYFLSEISILMSLGFLVFLIFGIFIGVLLNNKVLIWRKERNELDNLWSRYVVKIIMAKMEILQSGKISKEILKLHDSHEGQIYYNGKMAIYLVPFFVIGSFIVGFLLFFTFMYFGNLYFEGQISLGYIAGLTGAFLMMQTVFLNTLDFLKNFGKDFAEVQNLWTFFDTTPQIEGYETGDTFMYKNGSIELKNVNYGYTPDTPIFQNFDLKIAGNKVTALVGPSGGGKSTLVKLISGYIRQDSGDILIDNQNLKNTSLKSYYTNIGYLTQEPSVFDGTVRENLEYGVSQAFPHTKPHHNSSHGGEDEATKGASLSSEEREFKSEVLCEMSEGKLKNIIKLAHCEFIYDLPNGLDTEIGERGVKLSGGQKQRLAIAKIFLKDPKIIILDEPTSALDSLSEKKITEAMHNLFKNRTVLVIAHRLQTVKHADDIIVIKGGEILERGKHDELVNKDGFYKEMLDLQSGF